LGITLIILKAKKFNLKRKELLLISGIFIIVFFIGAKISSILRNIDYYFINPNAIFSLHGFGFYGGFIWAILFIYFFCKFKGINFLNFVDLGSPSLALGETIGRIGCFIRGCCYGKPTSLPWGVIYSSDKLAFKHFYGLPLHPTQIYYAILNFILFLFLLRLKSKFRGYIFLNYLIFHSVIRLIIDPLRGDIPYFLFNLPISWFLSIIIFLFSVILLWICSKRI
jgi:phosphatidylglycerol:prolipoprotein diacylglycerol transferase